VGEGDGGLPSLADTIAAVGRELGSAQAAGVLPERPVRAEGLEADEADDELANNGPSFRFGSILVITYGRSGSTLLQGILNSIDGLLIRGENHNFCYGLYLSYKSLLRMIGIPWIGDTTETPESAWFGCKEFDAETFLADSQVMLRKLLMGKNHTGNGVRCYGFKEIRYIEVDDRELLGYLGFLAQIFPNPGFIFLTRAHREVANSAWWRGRDPLVVERELLRGETRFKEFAQGKDNCFSLDYSDMVCRTQRLRDLFGFVGAAYSDDIIAGVLARPHSYVPTQDYVKSLAGDWYRKSLVISEELGDKPAIAGRYHQLGMVAQERGQLDEAEDWYRKSLAISEELGDKPGMTINCRILGIVAQRQGRPDEAEEWNRKSLAINEAGLGAAGQPTHRGEATETSPEVGQGTQISGLRQEPEPEAPQAQEGSALSERPVRAEGLEVREVDDGLVVYQAEPECVHHLNSTAAIVFELCDGENTVPEIGEQLARAFGLMEVPDLVTEECIADLWSKGVIV
jgi:tetratricopeptide (TPR) repeat protein